MLDKDLSFFSLEILEPDGWLREASVDDKKHAKKWFKDHTKKYPDTIARVVQYSGTLIAGTTLEHKMFASDEQWPTLAEESAKVKDPYKQR